VDLSKARLEVEKLVKAGPEIVTMGKLPQTPRAKKVIEYSFEEARNLNHNYVGTEHLLLGLCRETEGISLQVLTNLDVSVEDVREEVISLLGGVEECFGSPDSPKDEVVAPFSFRFKEHEQQIELLDAKGAVVDSAVLDGPIGAYMFNALRKHESSQALLRETLKFLIDLGTVGNNQLMRRIARLLDSV